MTRLTRRIDPRRRAGRARARRGAGPRRRRNTTPASPTPRSRSATPNPTAARPRPTATIGKAEAAYFKMINDQGGINGRKINFISYDDGYSPPKTVEQVRKLVEKDEVLLLFSTARHADQLARSSKYMNQKKVPQLFVATGATKWGDPKHFPGRWAGSPITRAKATSTPRYILKEHPERQDRRALPERRLRQGLPEGPEGRARRQGQVDDRRRGALRDDRSDRRFADRQPEGLRRRRVLQCHDIPKFAAQAIRKAAEIGWKPLHILNSVSAIRSARVLKPAGLENAKGIVSTTST